MAIVKLDRALEIRGVRRRIALELRLERSDGGAIRQASRDEVRQAHLVLRLLHIAQQLHRLLAPRAAFEDRPVVDRIDVAVPHDFEVPALLAIRDQQAAGTGHRDGHLAGRQQVRDLRDRGPPHRVRLDCVELAKRAIDALRRAQHLVDVRWRNAVRHQREFERVLRRAAQTAPAGKALHVPELGPVARTLPHACGVIAEQLRPHHRAHAAVVHRDVDVLLAPTQHLPIDRLEQALFAAEQQLFDLDLHHVPVVGAALHFRAQHTDAAVPNVLTQGNPGVHDERSPVRIAMRALRAAAPSDHGQLALISMGIAGCQCAEKNEQQRRTSCDAAAHNDPPNAMQCSALKRTTAALPRWS
jgi:hypothetical protein